MFGFEEVAAIYGYLRLFHYQQRGGRRKTVRLDTHQSILAHLMLVSNAFYFLETVYGRTADYEALLLGLASTAALCEKVLFS